MKLDEVKYSVCQSCGRRYPKAHCINGFTLSNGKPRPDRYIAHNNSECVPCNRNEKMRIDARAKHRALTDEEITRRKELVAALPDGI